MHERKCNGTRRKENYISQKETGKRGRRNGANDEAVEEGRRGLGRWLGLARPVSGLVKRARCSLVAGEGIVRPRIGALRLERERRLRCVCVCVCKERRRGRKEGEEQRDGEGEEKTAGILGCVRAEFGGGIHNFASCHSVSNRAFSTHSSCTPRGTYERVTRSFARRYGCDETMEGRARVDSSFSGLLSSGMRHFNPEECTSRRNTDAFPKLAVLSP